MRVAKITPNPFASDADSSDMRQYYHPDCMFETFKRVRAGTKVIESAADVEGIEICIVLSCYIIMQLVQRGAT